MLAAGYKPVNPSEQDWKFKCHPAYRNRNLHDPNWDAERGRYLMHHLTDEQRQQFNQLGWEPMEQQEQVWQQVSEESLAAAAAAKGE